MKIISVDRELNTDQNYVNYYYYFKHFQSRITKKKGDILQKNCQEINTKIIFMNFEILPLNHMFRKRRIFLFTDISQSIDQFCYCHDLRSSLSWPLRNSYHPFLYFWLLVYNMAQKLKQNFQKIFHDKNEWEWKSHFLYHFLHNRTFKEMLQKPSTINWPGKRKT